jgi:uncharacterized protein (TIGR02466 family)
MEMMVRNLFPTAVGEFSFDRDLTPAEEEFLFNQKTYTNTGNTGSVDKYVLKNEVMSDLSNFLQGCVDEYLHKIYSPKHQVKLRITQSWLNYTQPGQYHHKHAHPNSFISGVFYVKADSSVDKIIFHKDKYDLLRLAPADWNTYNSDSWWLEARSGLLYLFPSSLTHNVDMKSGDSVRISLAFNTFPVGFLGDEENSTALYLD